MKTNFLTIFTLALAIAFSAFTTKETTGVYKADIEKSTVAWLGEKVTGEHNGHVKLKEATLDIKKGKLNGGTFVIDMTTITNVDITDQEMNGKLVGHLKSDDFFSVGKHPTATFVIKSARHKSGDQYTIKGDLTIKGITKSIEFPATVKIDGDKLQADAKVVIDRAEFDVRYGSDSFFDNLGDKVIYDDFTLDIHLVASK